VIERERERERERVMKRDMEMIMMVNLIESLPLVSSVSSPEPTSYSLCVLD
jgi:hypothetical protein